MKNDSESRDINPIRLLCGGFLIFLSWKLLSSLINREATNIPLSIIFFVVFLVAGGIIIFIELKAYRNYTKRAKETKTEEIASEIYEESNKPSGDPE